MNPAAFERNFELSLHAFAYGPCATGLARGDKPDRVLRRSARQCE